MQGASAAPACTVSGATGLESDCQAVVSYLSNLDQLFQVKSNSCDAEGCTPLYQVGSVVGQMCGDDFTSSGDTCQAAATYLGTIIDTCADSSGEVHGSGCCC